MQAETVITEQPYEEKQGDFFSKFSGRQKLITDQSRSYLASMYYILSLDNDCGADKGRREFSEVRSRRHETAYYISRKFHFQCDSY